jgi:transposase
MDKGQFLIGTHLRAGQSIKALAAAHGVSESWLFRLLRRYRLEGEVGLKPRSRRPKSSPTRIADLNRNEIVRWHEELKFLKLRTTKPTRPSLGGSPPGAL